MKLTLSLAAPPAVTGNLGHCIVSAGASPCWTSSYRRRYPAETPYEP